MREFRRYSGRVREDAPRYDAGPAADRYPADEVLADLTSTVAENGSADGVRVARVIARYAALRTWLLRACDAPPSLVSHADSAARLHLAAVQPWEEGELLQALLAADLDRSAGLLALAAAHAGRAGDQAGAEALREAGRQALLLRFLRRRPPG